MEKSMFVNFTNHPSNNWSNSQLVKAKEYGEIVDLPFPNIPSNLSEEELIRMADNYVEKIYALKPKAVLCQGEMVFTHLMVNKLKEKGILVLAAISDRVTEEIKMDDRTLKTSEFTFLGFRKYI